MSVGYYQREYRWRRQDVEAMLEDLETSFMSNFTTGDLRQKVQQYSHYFLGPIVVSRKEGRHFLIDGQQRLTTLTLLLVYLNHLQQGRDELVRLDDLSYSERYGEKSFHLDVEERRGAMLALFEGRPYEVSNAQGSVLNLLTRYAEIEALFPEHLGTPETLPYFLDWLLDNVELVEITTYNDEDAYAIFETMNDRGLSLTPIEMLKAYLLSKLDSDNARADADRLWRTRMAQLAEFEADEDANFFKAWLRSQFAQSIRERKAGASNQDFDPIGSAFHKWVRDSGESKMGLRTATEFQTFLLGPYPKNVSWYILLREAEWEPTPGLEFLYNNAIGGFTLQPTLLLAPLCEDDHEETVGQKFAWSPGTSTCSSSGASSTPEPSVTRPSPTRCSTSSATYAVFRPRHWQQSSSRRPSSSMTKPHSTASLICDCISRPRPRAQPPSPPHGPSGSRGRFRATGRRRVP